MSGSQNDTGFSPQGDRLHTGPWPQSQGAVHWHLTATHNRIGQSRFSKLHAAPQQLPAWHPGSHTLLQPPQR